MLQKVRMKLFAKGFIHVLNFEIKTSALGLFLFLRIKKAECFERNKKCECFKWKIHSSGFWNNEAISRECQAFYRRLSEMVAEKRKARLSATSVIRTKISFSLVRSMLRYIRGSRSPTFNNLSDFHLADQAKIRRTD